MIVTLTDYKIEKQGYLWLVTIPYDESIPQLRQDEYNLDPIIIVEEEKDGDNYIKLEVDQCLVSDDGKNILFFCRAWKEQYKEEHEVKLSIRKVIGLRIKELRLQQRLSQQGLADKAGITKANICNIERGAYSVGLDILNRVAEALGAQVKIE